MKKKDIPWILLSIRAITFIPLILSMFNILHLSILTQIISTTIIIGSDIFDGKISRKYNNDKDKLRFRISDTIVDKTGIFMCLIGLFTTNKIQLSYFITILSYNLVLLTGGALNLIKTQNKEEKTVQGLFISRLFTFLTGVSIILLNNVSLSNVLSNILTLSMTGLGISSLSLQLKDKINQKEPEVKKDKVFKELEEKRNIRNIYLSKRNTKSLITKNIKEKTISHEKDIKNLKELKNHLTSNLTKDIKTNKIEEGFQKRFGSKID